MRNHLLGLALIVFGLMPGPSFGADSAPGTVTANGSAEVKRQAEWLRVRVEVLAKGKSAREALAKLRERKASAQKNLQAIGFAPGAIEFGEPEIVEEKNDRQNQFAMRMMMQQMQRGGAKPPQKPKEAPPVMVSCVLRAEFRLKPAEADEFLVAAGSLEDSMKAMDLGGLKALKQASGQDEELAQEAAQEAVMMDDGSTPKRGEPLFMYVSKISDQEQQKARAEAFKKAKHEAEELARAAGAELGSIHNLTDSATAVSGFDPYGFSRFNGYRLRQYIQQMQSEGGGDEELTPGEAIGAKPKKVVYRVMVSATFELKKPAK